MVDCFLHAKLEQIGPTICALPWLVDAKALMLLERIPLSLLTETERVKGIRLECFDPTTDFEQWGRGRIFATQGELRWEQMDGKFWAVFCGESINLPSFTSEIAVELQPEKLTLREQSYYLWGKRVQTKDLPKLGLPPQTVAFVELQIPRILHYPVTSSAKRVKLKMKEYYATDGALVYARFVGLEEEA